MEERGRWKAKYGKKQIEEKNRAREERHTTRIKQQRKQEK
jgi:hypothetical protein